jgi:dienelactone hydrolase
MGEHITYRRGRLEPRRLPRQAHRRGALFVCQEIFDVNRHIRAVRDRFAEAGYLAVALTLFDQAQKRSKSATPRTTSPGAGRSCNRSTSTTR